MDLLVLFLTKIINIYTQERQKSIMLNYVSMLSLRCEQYRHCSLNHSGNNIGYDVTEHLKTHGTIIYNYNSKYFKFLFSSHYSVLSRIWLIIRDKPIFYNNTKTTLLLSIKRGAIFWGSLEDQSVKLPHHLKV